MDVVFEAYTGNDGAITGHLALHSFMRASTDAFFHASITHRVAMEGAQVHDGAFTARLPPLKVRAYADASGDGLFASSLPISVNFASNELTPDLAIFLPSLPQLKVNMVGAMVHDGQFTSSLELKTLMSEAGSFFSSRLPLSAYFSDGVLHSDRVAFLLEQPELISSMSLGITGELIDTFHGLDDLDGDFIQALFDLIRCSDSYSHLANILQSLTDGLGMADVARLIWEAGLLDSFIASAVQDGTAQLVVFLKDSFVGSDGSTSLSEILAALSDGFYASLTLVSGDDTYTAWVMTPETKAMRSYSNFPFNSYAQMGDHFYGACDTGIYRMGGTTDDGDVIRAVIRTGLVNFGELNKSSVRRAYIGATTSGNLLLRVQAMTVKDVLLEQTYRLVPADITKPREHLQDVGKGFKSVYWTFELANDTDGADFEVTDWHVLPVTNSGRLS